MGVGASGTWLLTSLEANLTLAGFLFPRRLLLSYPSLLPDSPFPRLVFPSLCLVSLPSSFFHVRFLFLIGYFPPSPTFSPFVLYDVTSVCLLSFLLFIHPSLLSPLSCLVFPRLSWFPFVFLRPSA